MEPGPMPWPVPGLTAEKYAAMVREIKAMSCAIALYRMRQGDKSGALAAFRDGMQSLRYITNNAGDSPGDSIDFSAVLQPTAFAGAESIAIGGAMPADCVVATACEAIDFLCYRHDWMRDGVRPGG